MDYLTIIVFILLLYYKWIISFFEKQFQAAKKTLIIYNEDNLQNYKKYLLNNYGYEALNKILTHGKIIEKMIDISHDILKYLVWLGILCVYICLYLERYILQIPYIILLLIVINVLVMLVYEPSDALEHQHYITWHWFLVKYNFTPNINTSSQLSYWYITCLEFIMPVLGLLFITYIILMFYKDQNQNVITLNHAIIFILLLISMPNSAQLFYLLPSYKEAQKKQVKIDPKKIDNNFYIDDKSYDGILSTYFYVYCKDTKKIMDALDTVNITYDLYLMNPNILEIDFKNLKPEFISKIKLAASLLTKDPIINKSNMTLESIGEVVITKNI